MPQPQYLFYSESLLMHTKLIKIITSLAAVGAIAHHLHNHTAKFKIAARWLQNGRQGLESSQTLVFWKLPSTFASSVFLFKEPFYWKQD